MPAWRAGESIAVRLAGSGLASSERVCFFVAATEECINARPYQEAARATSVATLGPRAISIPRNRFQETSMWHRLPPPPAHSQTLGTVEQNPPGNAPEPDHSHHPCDDSHARGWYQRRHEECRRHETQYPKTAHRRPSDFLHLPRRQVKQDN